MNESFLLAQYRVENIFAKVEKGDRKSIAVCKYSELFLVNYDLDIDAFMDDYCSNSNIKEILNFIKDLLVIKNYTEEIELHKKEDKQEINQLLVRYKAMTTQENENHSEDVDYGKNVNSPLYSTHIERESQYSKYHTGKNGSTGHGSAAEDANALIDKFTGKNVEKVGVSNEKNGADRIVDNQPIQTKCYQTPSKTLDSFFEKGSNKIKYDNQLLEVPSDQYDAVVEMIQEKARKGELLDASGKSLSPEEAKKLIKKGSVTYSQAKNLAKAGTIESLTYDVASQAVVSVYVFGISSATNFAMSIWRGEKPSKALKEAGFTGLKAAGSGILVGVISSQFLRTQMGKSFMVMTRVGVKSLCKTTVGKDLIHMIAKTSGKNLTGAAAQSYTAKILGNNFIIGTATLIVTSAPDFYRAAISGDISWQQFSKNLTNNAAGIVGGIGGAFAAGALLGSVVPGIGTFLGAAAAGAGALVGGLVASSASQTITDLLCEDDTVKMMKILESSMSDVAYDYLLSCDELKRYQDLVMKMATQQWLVQMYNTGGKTSGEQAEFAINKLEQICTIIVSERPKIELPSEKKVRFRRRLDFLADTMLNLFVVGVFAYLTYITLAYFDIDIFKFFLINKTNW